MEPIDIRILKEGHAGALVDVHGNTMNYGVIRKVDGKLVFYTGRGLREIWSPNMNEAQKARAANLKSQSEAELRMSGHIDEIDITDIRQILF